MSRTLNDLRKALRTVVGVTVTPFSEDGRIDEAAYREIVSRTVTAGISALTPNGNTSEFYSLKAQERRRAVELTVDAADGAVIIAGVGLDAATAIEDAKYYRGLGVQCVMLHQPVHPFWSAEGWVKLHQEVGQAVPDMGLIPYLRDPKVNADSMRELIATTPNLIAVKYALPNPASFASLVGELGDTEVTWICGVAETWAPFFAIGGATGFTSGLVNVDPARSLRMLEHLQNKNFDAAMAEWKAIAGFEAMRARHASEHNVTVVKEALAQIGLCRRDVRAPLSLLANSDRAAVGRILASWNLSPATTT